MSEESAKRKVQFVPFSSFIDPGFWAVLTEKKLNDYKLDDSLKPMVGYYVNSDVNGLPCRHTVDHNSFSESFELFPANQYISLGKIAIPNTLDAFKRFDKAALIHESGSQIWFEICAEKILDNPSILSQFLLLCFVDVKRYHYTYWFAYPALTFDDAFGYEYASDPVKLSQVYNPEELASLSHECTQFLKLTREHVFVVTESKDAGGKHSFTVSNLASLRTRTDSERIIAFCDPATNDACGGWPLRNLLAFCLVHCRDLNGAGKPLRVLCWRNRFTRGSFDCTHSLLLSVSFRTSGDFHKASDFLKIAPKTVGWERNEAGHLGPNFVDLSSTMDPTKIAENAADLNLQLMRWRLVPDLDLGILNKARCLLIGAGTLGCNVARCLMAWGVKHISFVDSSTVHFNNPVRQSLYTFEDAIEGDKRKTVAAVENIRKIFPRMKSEGFDLMIPMPGHVVSEKELPKMEKTVERLEHLIETHDVIFLLTDTRESRWLPTMLGTFHSKLTFSVALGFDSFVVVRHGFGRCAVPMKSSVSGGGVMRVPGDQLGCYFCTDVVAPGNSMVDRTLDQECTVTRPGVSYLASGLAVELMAALLEHPLGGKAPAETAELTDAPTSPLGLVPHQIRGFLSRFDQMTPVVERFASCIACSEKVMCEYEKRRFAFIADAINDPHYLEKLTGLDELQASTANVEVFELSDTESVKSLE